MAKLTKTKTDPATGHVYVVSYGFDVEFARKHGQYPHLSVTGEHWEGTPRRRTESNLVSMGCLHGMVCEQFPELAALVPFHLCDSTGEPMHYVENAVYLHGNDAPGFLRHVLHYVPGIGPVADDVWMMGRDALKTWLDDRLQLIRAAMVKACADCGVPWPRNPGECDCETPVADVLGPEWDGTCRRCGLDCGNRALSG